MMVEPLAAGVLGPLMFPRAGYAATRSNGLGRATRSSGQISLSANFFTPTPRRQKSLHNANAVVTTIAGNVLYCQSWASPRSKEWLWHYDGPMRALLLAELEEPRPTRSGARSRRCSKSNRGRIRTLAPQRDPGIKSYHHAYSTSPNARLATPPIAQASTSQDMLDEEAIASTSLATDILQSCLERIATAGKNIPHNLQEYDEVLEILSTSGIVMSAPFHEALRFAELLADQVDEMCAHRLPASVIRKWGKYIFGLQSTLGKTAASSSSPTEDDRMEALLYRAHAFKGQLTAVQQLLTDVVDKFDISTTLPHASLDSILRSYLLAMSSYHGDASVFEYLETRQAELKDKPGADRLYILLTDTTFRHFLSTTFIRHSNQIRRIVTTCQPPLPLAFHKQIVREMDASWRYEQLDFGSGQPEQPCVVRQTIDDLSRAQSTGPQMDPFLDSDRHVQNLSRHLPSIQAVRGWDFTTSSADAIRKFEESYPSGPDGQRPRRPSAQAYYSLFKILEQSRLDAGNLLYLLEVMIHHDFIPFHYHFNAVIRACRSRNDREGVFSVIRAMKQGKVKGNQHIYTSLISFFAKILDTKTAREIHEQAMKSGIVPDAVMNNAILYAYGRQGNYSEALQFFRVLQSSPNGVDSDTYNTMMKIVLLSGSPLSTAMALFTSLDEKGLTPNKFTYGTLINAAVNHEQLGVARRLYGALLEREEQTGEEWVNVQILTTLFKGFVEAGFRHDAESILEDMGRRGINPNAFTYNVLLRTHASPKNRKQMRAAEILLAQLAEGDQAWAHLTDKSRQVPKAMVYGSVLHGHMRRRDVDSAERTLDTYISTGGVPTVSHLNTLLTLYRDVGQVDKALLLWPRILDAAKEQSQMLDISGKAITTQIAQINVALSTFTQVASRAGYHSEVVEAWRDVLDGRPLAPDETNWNDFILACLRAGQVLRAFQATERFLVPLYASNRSAYHSLRGMQAPSEQPRWERLAELPDAPNLTQPVMTVRQQKRRNLKGADLSELVPDDDLDSKLELLRVLNPLWKNRRPHHVVLVALRASLISLNEGHPIRAIRIDEDPSEDVLPSNVIDFDATQVLLTKIQRTCPGTIEYLEGFEKRLLREEAKNKLRKKADK